MNNGNTAGGRSAEDLLAETLKYQKKAYRRAGITAFAINAQGLIVGLCFASGLAPIAGEYGIPAGIVAGMLHYCLVTSVPFIHGGFNLYNGGFTSGIVCFIYVPILEHYFKKKGERKLKA